MSIFGKRSPDLLSYEDVRKQLKAVIGNRRQLMDVPLDAIVGSVGRKQDFSRTFLPRHDSLRERWNKVARMAHGTEGLPPVELYQIGHLYFVEDGHHRVSVARQDGHSHIEAYVTEASTAVKLNPDMKPDEVLSKGELLKFFEQTGLNELRPGTDFKASSPGGYGCLLEHIDVHRYFMGIEQSREVPYQEAVQHWHDTVYAPVVEVIQKRKILADFPGSTQLDLYLWFTRHRVDLEQELGWQPEPTAAVSDFAKRHGSAPGRVISRAGRKLLKAILPMTRELGRPSGEWRRERLETREGLVLFSDVLAVTGVGPIHWYVLDEALNLARREGGEVHGLYIVESKEKVKSAETTALAEEFRRRCESGGFKAKLTAEAGDVIDVICERARFVDLIVFDVVPERLGKNIPGSELYHLIPQSSRPILVVSGPAQQLRRALLIYDGRPESGTALFVAEHLAHRHGIELKIFSTTEGDWSTNQKTVKKAREHFEKSGIQVEVLEVGGRIVPAVLQVARESECEWIIAPGYAGAAVAGDTFLDKMIRVSERPLLICP